MQPYIISLLLFISFSFLSVDVPVALLPLTLAGVHPLSVCYVDHVSAWQFRSVKLRPLHHGRITSIHCGATKTTIRYVACRPDRMAEQSVENENGARVSELKARGVASRWYSPFSWVTKRLTDTTVVLGDPLLCVECLEHIALRWNIQLWNKYSTLPLLEQSLLLYVLHLLGRRS